MVLPLPALLLVLGTQIPVQLELQVSPGTAVVYSNAVLAEATLSAQGQPLVDQRVDFFLRSDDQGITCSPGSWPATDLEGRAGPLKIRFVDGACGVDHFVGADPDGEPYLLEVRSAATATHAAASASAELRLHREVATLQLLPEHSAVLGEELLLVATLLDPTGDVDEGSADTQGRAPAAIAGAPVFFYLDLDDDGDFGGADEALGSAPGNEQGTASVRFDTTPVAGLPRAGLHRDAVRAEFAGDARYKFAAALGDLRLLAAPVDATRTVLEVEPGTAAADGQSLLVVRAMLRDRFGSRLGPDDDPHAVGFETSAGELLAAVERDPASGLYLQSLRAPDRPGTATVRVLVDGAGGPQLQITFTDAGCGCRGLGPPAAPSAALLALGWRWRRRRP